MARTTFSRTVVKTYCETIWFDQNNVKHEDTIMLFGDYDLASAQNAVKKKLNARGALVQKVSHKSYFGSVTLERFDKVCEKKDFKEW